MDTLVQHDLVIEELVKEVKDLKKEHATTTSVDTFIEDVKNIAARDILFDMLIGGSQPPPLAQTSQPSTPYTQRVPHDATHVADRESVAQEEQEIASSTTAAFREMFTTPTVGIDNDIMHVVEEEQKDDSATSRDAQGVFSPLVTLSL